VVPGELDGARLDKAVATLLGVSRNEARRLCDSGVLLQGQASPAKSTVSEGDRIVAPVPTGAPSLAPEPVKFEVLLETADYLVVDKPAGLVVHPGSGHSSGTLAAGLLSRYPDIEGVGEPGRWGLVHRLDRDTSGVMIVARTAEAHTALSEALANRRIKRVYTALVSGVLDIPTGTIDAPIGRDPAQPMRRAVVASGKPAVTHYVVDRVYPQDDATLIEVTLETGRTHQIRVHLAAIDHPVIGDRTYGGRPTRVKAPRTFLHAAEISFVDPIFGEPVHVKSELPHDLVAVLDGLGEPTFS
jgi:23S rRNA pseudouridine1911/1915/1917 synthase